MLLKGPLEYELNKLIEEVLKEQTAQRSQAQKIFDHNSKTILKYLGKAPKFSPDKELEDLKQIPTLYKDILTKHLGSGQYGLVFLTNNGRVFKLFTGGTAGASSDIQYYQNLQNSQFSGRGSASAPAVYDVGQAGNLFYVEMGKVIPLKDYMGNRYPKKGLSGIFDSIVGEMFGVLGLNTRNSDKQEFIQKFKQVGFESLLKEVLSSMFISFIQELNQQEIASFMKAWISAFLNSNKKATELDAHGGNLGVSIQNPAQWVMFDI